MIGMLIIVILLCIAFGVCLPNVDDGPGYAIGLWICLIMVAGILGGSRA